MTTVKQSSKVSKEEIIIHMDNPYVQCLFKAFKQFLLEEAVGNGITSDLRLSKKIAMARELFSAERKVMNNQGDYFGRWDESNVKLVFVKGGEISYDF